MKYSFSSRFLKVAEPTDLKQTNCIPHSEGGKLEREEKGRRKSTVLKKGQFIKKKKDEFFK